MYICVCKAVTDKQITNAIHEGMCTSRQLFQCFGVGGDCGKCSRHVKELLRLNCPKQPIIETFANASVLNA
jgi:bacterioferritin-associated ferredoxin